MLAKNFARFSSLLLLFVLLGNCHKQVNSSSLKVYIEDPAFFYALSIYQQQEDSAPLSIHLRRGLDMFFQLSERSIKTNDTIPSIGNQQSYRDNKALHLAQGGGLFLSSKLMQLAELKPYMEKLPPRSIIQLDIPNSPYLTPLLLYPVIFEIAGQAGQNKEDLLLRNLAQSKLSRLLSQDWLKEQLLLQPQASTYLQTPRQILLDYLHNSPLQVYFGLQGFRHSDIPQEFQQFISDYRALLTKKREQNSEKGGQESQTEETLKSLKNSGMVFTRLQHDLYKNILKEYSLSYRNVKAPIAPSAYPYLYFKGQLQEPTPTLQLQLEQVLWAGLSKNLSKTHQQQATKLLNWLQSLEGQQTLQRELPQFDSALGIFRGLSIYPEVNILFWQNLQLDWPERFNIRWQLPSTLIQWDPKLFEQASSRHSLRKHSASSVANSFLLPYLFLPDSEKQQQSTDWSQWLQTVE